MARYKPVDRSARLLPVVLSEQLLPGSFEFVTCPPPAVPE